MVRPTDATKKSVPPIRLEEPRTDLSLPPSVSCNANGFSKEATGGASRRILKRVWSRTTNNDLRMDTARTSLHTSAYLGSLGNSSFVVEHQAKNRWILPVACAATVVCGCTNMLLLRWINNQQVRSCPSEECEMVYFRAPIFEQLINAVSQALWLPFFYMYTHPRTDRLGESIKHCVSKARPTQWGKTTADSPLESDLDLIDHPPSYHENIQEIDAKSPSPPTATTVAFSSSVVIISSSAQPTSGQHAFADDANQPDSQQSIPQRSFCRATLAEPCEESTSTDTTTRARVGRAMAPKWVWVLPALLDLCGSLTLLLALAMVPASSVAIMRNMSVLVCASLSICVLKRNYKIYNWMGILIISAGLTITAIATAGSSSDYFDSESSSAAWQGHILILVGTVFSVGQYLEQERLLRKYDYHPVEATGWSGSIQSVMVLFLSLLAYVVDYENLGTVAWQASTRPSLMIALGFVALSVAVFMAASFTVTKNEAALLACILHAMRQVVIWVTEVSLGWEPYSTTSLVGLLLSVVGFAIFRGWFPSKVCGAMCFKECRFSVKVLTSNQAQDEQQRDEHWPSLAGTVVGRLTPPKAGGIRRPAGAATKSSLGAGKSESCSTPSSKVTASSDDKKQVAKGSMSGVASSSASSCDGRLVSGCDRSTDVGSSVVSDYVMVPRPTAEERSTYIRVGVTEEWVVQDQQYHVSPNGLPYVPTSSFDFIDTELGAVRPASSPL